MIKALLRAAIVFCSFAGVAALFVQNVAGYASGERSSPRSAEIRSLLTIERAVQAIDAAENALLSRDIDAKQRLSIYKLMKEAGQRLHEARLTYQKRQGANNTGFSQESFVPALEKWWRDHELFLELAGANDKNENSEAYRAMSVQALETNAASLSAVSALLRKEIELELKQMEDSSGHAITPLSKGGSTKEALLWGPAIFGVLAVLTLIIPRLFRRRKHKLILEVGSFPPVLLHQRFEQEQEKA